VGGRDARQVAAGGVQDAFGLAVERMCRGCRAGARRPAPPPGTPDRPPRKSRDSRRRAPPSSGRASLALDDDDLLERGQIAHNLIHAVLHRGRLALARGPSTVISTLAAENSIRSRTALRRTRRTRRCAERRCARMRASRRRPPGSSAGRSDHVALFDTQVLQSARKALDLPEQLSVGDVTLRAILPAPVKRDALALPASTWRSRQL